MFAAWLTSHLDPAHRRAVEEKWALGFGFITRHSVDTTSCSPRWRGRCPNSDNTARDIAYFAAVYHVGKLRGNFWFDALYEPRPCGPRLCQEAQPPVTVGADEEGVGGEVSGPHLEGRLSALVKVCLGRLLAESVPGAGILHPCCSQ
jgi:hypothetical protein